MSCKMDLENRAKQFQPFAALKGYSESLSKKEIVMVPKIELSEEYQEELEWSLKDFQESDTLTVIYYRENQYLKITGRIERIDFVNKQMIIDRERIAFEDIYKMYAAEVEIHEKAVE